MYYSEVGMDQWEDQNQKVLMSSSIRDYYDELKIIKSEESKIH